jgi:hypothetical protein
MRDAVMYGSGDVLVEERADPDHRATDASIRMSHRWPGIDSVNR